MSGWDWVLLADRSFSRYSKHLHVTTERTLDRGSPSHNIFTNLAITEYFFVEHPKASIWVTVFMKQRDVEFATGDLKRHDSSDSFRPIKSIYTTGGARHRTVFRASKKILSLPCYGPLNIARKLQTIQCNLIYAVLLKSLKSNKTAKHKSLLMYGVPES